MNKQLSALLLSASLLAAPLSAVASAEPAQAPPASYQVALLGHHTGATKHHRLRNTALVVGGALVARHVIKKHSRKRAAGY